MTTSEPYEDNICVKRGLVKRLETHLKETA